MEANTVNVASSFYQNFLKKAEECHTGMNAAFASDNWNMAVIAAVHCGISAAEYEERLMSKSDASDALRDAERFYKWVKEVLGA